METIIDQEPQDAYAPETPKEAAGRLMMIGWEGRDSGEIRELIDEFRPGGLIFFRRNYPISWDTVRFDPNYPLSLGPNAGEPVSLDPGKVDLKAPALLQEILDKVQKYALKTLGRPLIIALDQEGGQVRRLKEPYFKAPSARVLGGMEPLEVQRLAYRMGRELKETGFNLNLAPVLDLDLKIDEGLKGYIGDRSLGAEPLKVTVMAKAFVAGLLKAGVLACGKHFPGLGGAVLDPHEKAPEINLSPEEMAGSLSVFKEMIAANLPALMTTHALYPSLDPECLATFSQKIVQLLRVNLGFKGLLLSDDLEMGAIAGERDLGQAAVRSVLAGHDLLLVCRKITAIRTVQGALVTAISQGQITEGHLLESSLRLNGFLAQVAKTSG
ncbi:MAG: beta-N-acetylhexosaminidase [Deltaproteobacteria bacterium]|jgi:beta-N-acetylhexosaminidase|nr:beta-N-acetylhexosaminidase [Deltaproteobacteria bacterium]